MDDRKGNNAGNGAGTGRKEDQGREHRLVVGAVTCRIFGIRRVAPQHRKPKAELDLMKAELAFRLAQIKLLAAAIGNSATALLCANLTRKERGLRPEATRGPGVQLALHPARSEMVPVVPRVWPGEGDLRQELEVAGHREGEVN